MANEARFLPNALKNRPPDSRLPSDVDPTKVVCISCYHIHHCQYFHVSMMDIGYHVKSK
jgi:hypothetical protein